MNDTATKPAKIRKPNIGSDPTKGALVKRWQTGFYAFAIGASVIMVGVCLLLIFTGRFSRLFTAATVLVTGLSVGILRAKSGDFEEPDGSKVNNIEPELNAFVQQVADQVGAPMPDAIYLSATAEFGIAEATQYFGRTVEKSVLTIGLPFLQSLTRQELAALLAYELGQYGDLGIEQGPAAQRSLRSAYDLIKIERDGFINGVYGSYARKMFRSIGGVGVAQEEAADKIAVDTYGTSAMLSALDKLDDIPVAFDQMLREYVVPALQNQMHPVDMFGGFGELLGSSSRADERARQVEKRRAKERNEFVLSLQPVERSARVQDREPVAAQVTVDRATDAAHTLLDPAAKSSEIAVGSWATNLMTHRTEPQSWDELVDQVYSTKTQSLASMVFEQELDAGEQLEVALKWSENDEWGLVDGSMEACLKSIKDPTERRTKWARCVVVEAAAATGAFSWQHCWDGPPKLVDATGDSLDAAGIASMIADGAADDARSAFATATALS